MKVSWNVVTGIELGKAINDDVRKVWSFFYWTEQTYPWEILVLLRHVSKNPYLKLFG